MLSYRNQMQKPKPFKFSDKQDSVDTKHVLEATVANICTFECKKFKSINGIITSYWRASRDILDPSKDDIWFILSVYTKSCYKNAPAEQEIIVSDGTGWYSVIETSPSGHLILLVGHWTMSVKSKHIINTAISKYCAENGMNT
jgi:hypothetical protein